MILKWIFDRVVALVGLLVLWPVLVVVAIMVKVKIGVHSKKIISTSYLPVYVYRGVLNKQ